MIVDWTGQRLMDRKCRRSGQKGLGEWKKYGGKKEPRKDLELKRWMKGNRLRANGTE